MARIEEDNGFVVERGSFSLAPPNSPDPQPRQLARPKSAEPLTAVVFTIVWLIMLLLHGLCACYLLAMAMLYFFMENPLMAYYSNLLALPEQRYFRLFGTLVGLLGALHGLQLVLHLLWTIKARAPAVYPRAAMVNRAVKLLCGTCTNKTAKKPAESRSPSSRTRSSITAISSMIVSGLQNVMSVEGNHFALVFMARKAVETGAQIVQCHRYCSLIGRVWINEAYAAMVVVSCWVTPLLDHLMLSSEKRAVIEAAARNVSKVNIAVPIRERTLCVTVDMLLTVTASLVLPLAIFVPYAQVFDTVWLGFPLTMLYGDVSFPNLIRENQALFALSFLDGVTKLVPHLSILFGMASISLILEVYPPLRFKRKAKTTASVADSVAVRGKSKTTVSKATKATNLVGLSFFRRVMAPLGFVAAGAVVLGLHLHAAHLANTADADTMKMCLQGLRPWFAENVSCSVLEYNCHKHGVVSPSSEALDHLQNDAVTAVVFEHCSEFEMPPSIRRFSNLLGLELWNVTLVKWGADTALNADLHPNMIYLVMVYTNMAAMPQGLLEKPLPPLLGDIEICITNLTVIPDELADAWENVRLVYFEHAPLKEFPAALFKIPSLSVSLIDNGLEAIPDDLFTTISLLDEYLEIAFSYNPIKVLPAASRDGLLINYLSIDHTEITELPEWTNDVGQWISLGGSPICNDTEAELPEVVGCWDGGWNPIVDGRYPLGLVAPLRQVE